MEEKILSPSCLYNRRARGRSLVWWHSALFIQICNLEILESAEDSGAHAKRENLQVGSLFLCYNPSEDRHTRKTLLLTASGSGELEGGTAAGGCIFLFSAGTVLEGAGAVVRLSVSAGLIVSLTTDLDVFRRLIN